MVELAPAAGSPTSFPERPVNILLVDDQPANMLALEAILDDLGHNLVKASSGDEALAQFLTDDYAVVLLDVQMQGLDGFETATLMRARKPQRTPIIFLTAYDSNRLTVEEAYSLGAVDFLVKPLVPVILRAKVSGFVELFQKTETVKRQAEQLRQLERQLFDQKLAEENARLRESEQRFARFMQHLPGLAWIKDKQGRYVYANEAAEKAFCTPRPLLYGRTDHEIFPPEVAVQFCRNDEQALASESGIQVIETLPHDDGVVHHSIVSKFPIPGPHGKGTLIGGMAVDITDRLRAEESLREADRLKDEFLAMLAHELRNPLAPIRTALHILKESTTEPSDIERVIDVAERQVRHMARLLDDLLDMSRISRGRIELRKEIVDVAPLLRRTLDAVKPLADEHQHELTLSMASGSIQVVADPTRLEQVVTNLLNNACKYTKAGGRIAVAAEVVDDTLLLRVRDNGIGIAAEMLPRIFDLFVQAERQLDRAHGGVGIGLTLVRRLIELHGGTVEARSAGLGQGSEFIVRLPALAITNACGQSFPEEALTAPCARRRVLVVDDNRDAAETLAMLLRLMGQDVRVVYDGRSALEQAPPFAPALIFLDIGMPEMDGYEVARRLRREAALEKTIIVALTGWGQEEDRRRSREAGFHHHFVKPLEPGDLANLLR